MHPHVAFHTRGTESGAAAEETHTGLRRPEVSPVRQTLVQLAHIQESVIVPVLLTHCLLD